MDKWVHRQYEQDSYVYNKSGAMSDCTTKVLRYKRRYMESFSFMESYTTTRLDFRSSLIKSHNSLFYSIQYFIPLSPFSVPTA